MIFTRSDVVLDRTIRLIDEHEREAAAVHAAAEKTAATLARLQLLDMERRVLNRPVARAWRHCR